MNWFNRWFLNKIRWVQDHESKLPTPIRDDTIELELPNTIRFQITPARGGSVVTVNSYDQRKDQTNRTVYVIDENSDLSKRIAEIVSMEMYRS